MSYVKNKILEYCRVHTNPIYANGNILINNLVCKKHSIETGIPFEDVMIADDKSWDGMTVESDLFILELIMYLEKEFNIVINDNETFLSLYELCDLVERKLDEKK